MSNPIRRIAVCTGGGSNPAATAHSTAGDEGQYSTGEGHNGQCQRTRVGCAGERR